LTRDTDRKDSSKLIRGDLVGASSNVNVLERRASQLAGRNMSAKPNQLGVNSAASKRPM
jgi:hypothetical protein